MFILYELATCEVRTTWHRVDGTNVEVVKRPEGHKSQFDVCFFFSVTFVRCLSTRRTTFASARAKTEKPSEDVPQEEVRIPRILRDRKDAQTMKRLISGVRAPLLEPPRVHAPSEPYTMRGSGPRSGHRGTEDPQIISERAAARP